MGPPPALAAARRAVRELLAGPGAVSLTNSRRVLVACSGGADSLALAAAAAFVAPRAGLAAGLVTVDHGMQPAAEAQARRVAMLGRELGLDPVEILRVQVGSAGGPEAAARSARYAALDAAAAALDAPVLLGHTLDDQAETVLLGLGRGSGPRSVAGMRPVDGRWLRPFLGLRRADTAAACAAAGLEPWDDPHNQEPRFQRVRLRTEVLPLLDDVLQGGVARALARTAELLRDDLDALDQWADAAYEAARETGEEPAARPGDPAALAADRLLGLPRAVRTRVLRRWLEPFGGEPLTAERTAAVDSLVTAWHGQGPVELPGAVTVARRSGRLVVATHRPPAAATGSPG